MPCSEKLVGNNRKHKYDLYYNTWTAPTGRNLKLSNDQSLRSSSSLINLQIHTNTTNEKIIVEDDSRSINDNFLLYDKILNEDSTTNVEINVEKDNTEDLPCTCYMRKVTKATCLGDDNLNSNGTLSSVNSSLLSDDKKKGRFCIAITNESGKSNSVNNGIGVISLKNGDNSTSKSALSNSTTSDDTPNDFDNASTSSDSSAVFNRVRYETDIRIMNSCRLIQMERPANVPRKPLDEQLKHQKEYEKMMEIIRKKEKIKEEQSKRKYSQKLKEEGKVSKIVATWTQDIIPNWEQRKNCTKTKNLWWKGLPSSVRGKVWRLAIGNKLNLTAELYDSCLSKSKELLKTGSRSSLELSESQEASVELIRLDVNRTFPTLCIFQKGGPYYELLHCLLGAYVCYRPEVGYVQGMSFIAAILLLNMDQLDAFICFANLLDWPCHKAFYILDIPKMRCYFSTYNELLRANLPCLWEHFCSSCLTPDLYLVDWVYTVFSKSMNLDVACRIWDIFIRDGDEFLFRAAIGILHATKDVLMKLDFLNAAQYLTKLPDDISVDHLFKSISTVQMEAQKRTFHEILLSYQNLERK